MPIAWHHKRCGIFVCQKMTKKKKKIWNWLLLKGFKSVCWVVYSMGVLKPFGTENCVWIFLSDVFNQNVSIPSDQNISQGAKCFNSPTQLF